MPQWCQCHEGVSATSVSELSTVVLSRKVQIAAARPGAQPSPHGCPLGLYPQLWLRRCCHHTPSPQQADLWQGHNNPEHTHPLEHTGWGSPLPLYPFQAPTPAPRCLSPRCGVTRRPQWKRCTLSFPSQRDTNAGAGGGKTALPRNKRSLRGGFGSVCPRDEAAALRKADTSGRCHGNGAAPYHDYKPHQPLRHAASEAGWREPIAGRVVGRAGSALAGGGPWQRWAALWAAGNQGGETAGERAVALPSPGCAVPRREHALGWGGTRACAAGSAPPLMAPQAPLSSRQRQRRARISLL